MPITVTTKLLSSLTGNFWQAHCRPSNTSWLAWLVLHEDEIYAAGTTRWQANPSVVWRHRPETTSAKG